MHIHLYFLLLDAFWTMALPMLFCETNAVSSQTRVAAEMETTSVFVNFGDDIAWGKIVDIRPKQIGAAVAATAIVVFFITLSLLSFVHCVPWL